MLLRTYIRGERRASCTPSTRAALRPAQCRAQRTAKVPRQRRLMTTAWAVVRSWQHSQPVNVRRRGCCFFLFCTTAPRLLSPPADASQLASFLAAAQLLCAALARAHAPAGPLLPPLRGRVPPPLRHQLKFGLLVPHPFRQPRAPAPHPSSPAFYPDPRSPPFPVNKARLL